MRNINGSSVCHSTGQSFAGQESTHRTLRRLLAAGSALAGLSLAGLAAPANAAAIFWDAGGGDSNWGTKNNWSGNAVPGVADDVTIDTNAGVNTAVVLNVGAIVKTLTIDKGDSLSASNGKSFTVNGGGGSVTNNGLWSINATTTNTSLTLNGSSTLGGTGVLSLSDDAQNFINSNAATNVITNAATHTIQGSGQLLNNQAGMVNEGTIKATGTLAALVIDPSTAGFINKGVLQAVGAAGIDFNAGAFTNTGFSIDVLNGSRLDLNNSSKVTGGTLTTAGTGIISANTGATLDGVTLAGNAVQDNGQNVTVVNGLTNNGQWSINATTSNTILTLNGSSTLGGTGVLSLSDDAQNFINSNAAANVITNAAGHTIQGSGQLLNNQAGMVNEGTIKATGATAALVINPSTAGFENKGVLRAEGSAGIDLTDGANTKNTVGSVEVGGGSRIDVTGNYQQTGGSTVVELGGLLTATGNVNITGGSLGGNGVIDANVINSGGVTGAGMSVGLLTIDGKYTQSALGAFEVEIDSLTSFDFVRVLDAASLNGLLNIVIDDLLANSSFAEGSTFEILNAASITGTFSALTDNYSELVFSHQIAAGSHGGQSVYLTLIENNFAPPGEVPEPLTLPLLGAGLTWMGALRQRMRGRLNRLRG